MRSIVLQQDFIESRTPVLALVQTIIVLIVLILLIETND